MELHHTLFYSVFFCLLWASSQSPSAKPFSTKTDSEKQHDILFKDENYGQHYDHSGCRRFGAHGGGLLGDRPTEIQSFEVRNRTKNDGGRTRTRAHFS